jgi:hypothetical protein
VIEPPSGYLWALRIEHPVDQLPPLYRIFREEFPQLGSFYFPQGDPPAVGDVMRLWYASAHTLTATQSTILQEHEELITLGGVSYAADAATRYAIGRLNASLWTPRGLQAFALEKKKEYTVWLEQLRASYGTSGAPMVQWGEWPWDWNRV